MNRPIDPREGNRRQKALRERLAQLAQGRNKAMVGKLGQTRGRVKAAGAIGGARGARIAQGARPGALNFLQQPGFGLRARDMGRGPEMIAEYGPPGLVRHASNPLPSKPLPGPQAGPPWTAENPMPGNMGQNPNPLAGTPDPTPGYGLPDGIVPENYNPNPDPGMSIWGVPLDQGPQGTGPVVGAGSSAGSNGLIALGGGQYLDPATGMIHGVGPSGGGGGNMWNKAM